MATDAKTKEYIRPMPANWWLKQPAYTRFMIREITSCFIAGYCVFLIVLMCRARPGEEQLFQRLFESLKSPLSMVLHLIVLAFAVYHSVTFFNLTPKVLVVRRGEEKIPDAIIAGAHYAAWLIVSIIVIVIAMVV